MEVALDVPVEGQKIQIPYKGSVVEICTVSAGRVAASAGTSLAP
jgi:hypothetical protein